MFISIIIPCFNEEKTIGRVIEDVKNVLEKLPEKEIIIINDGSRDNSEKIIDEKKGEISFLRSITHKINKGYGASLKAGIRQAKGKIVIFFDADGQHSADDIPKIIELFKNKGCDAVFTQRKKYSHTSVLRRPGKFILSIIANILLGKKIPDINSGLRGLKKEIIKKYLHILPDQFSFSTTTIFLIVQKRYYVEWLDINPLARKGGRSYVSIWRDGYNTILLMIRLIVLFNPFRIFFPISLFSTILGIAWGIRYAIMGRGLSVGALLLILSGFLFFLIGILADQVSQIRISDFEKEN